MAVFPDELSPALLSVNADGTVDSAPLTVDGALAPAAPVTLRVVGAGGRTVEVLDTSTSPVPSLLVDNDAVQLAPTSIFGSIQPGARAALELSQAASGQALLAAYGASGSPELELKDGILRAPLTTVNGTGGMPGMPALQVVGAATVSQSLQVQGSATVSQSLQVQGGASVAQALCEYSPALAAGVEELGRHPLDAAALRTLVLGRSHWHPSILANAQVASPHPLSCLQPPAA